MLIDAECVLSSSQSDGLDCGVRPAIGRGRRPCQKLALSKMAAPSYPVKRMRTPAQERLDVQ